MVRSLMYNRYHQNWSLEVFVIAAVVRMSNVFAYKVFDQSGTSLSGTYLDSELNKAA